MKRRKGISPVIAVLLLIVIAVAAAVLAYVWITGYIGTLQSQSSSEQLQERVKIDAVEYNGTAVKIYVTNIGETDVTIVSAYVLDPDGTVVASSTGLTITVGANGGTNTITVTASGLSGRYIAKVVTSRGTEATYTFRV